MEIQEGYEVASQHAIGFKVVREMGDGLGYRSATIDDVGSGMVEYGTDFWTKPMDNYGPLCVFDTLFNARKFRRECGGDPSLSIYRCRYIKPRTKLGFTGVWARTFGFRPLRTLPVGTRLAGEVQLIERMV